MTIVREPNERDAHTGVWTGREFLIWGGSNSAGFGTVVSSGGAYQVNADSDGDGIAGAFDCLPLDASAFAIPTEVSGLNFSGPNQLVWNEAASTSGTGTTYTIVRVDLLSLSAQSSWSCLGTNVTLPDFVDLATPTLNQGYAYLVEAENGCGKSGLGADSDGIPRAAPICN